MTRRRGFTLAEMVIAASISGVILTGMASAMLIAAKAAPGRTGTTEMTLQAGRAADWMSADIACAKGFSVLGAGSIEMTVPDRTGDGLAETVRYRWSGTSGTPLYRTFNGGSAVAVASDVRQFNLAYVKTAAKQPTSYSETGETLLFCTDNGSATYSALSVTANNGAGVTFLPAWPSNASYLRITRAIVILKATSLTSYAEVRAVLRSGTAVSSLSTTVLDYAKVYATPLYGVWTEAAFNKNAQIAPGGTVAILLMNTGSDFQAGLRTNVSIANAALAYTSGGNGTSWSIDSGRTLPAYVFGVYGTKNADAYAYNLTHVTCTLKCGNSSIAQVRSDFQALNAPQVSGP